MYQILQDFSFLDLLEKLVSSPISFFKETDPLQSSFLTMIIVSLLCFINGNVQWNFSQVDKIWSITPMVYTLIFALNANNDRGYLILFMVIFWGVRLTINFYRKGGYNGEEDYRWAVLQKTITSPLLWQIFHLFFICLFQNILLLAICLPAYQNYLYKNDPINLVDVIAFFSMMIFLLIELQADNEQWDFYTERNQRINDKQPYDPFNTTGLFAYSRHPNFFAEIMIWWSLYLFSTGLNGGEIINQSIIGAILLTLLFQGSTQFTEQISLSKYPSYQIYQQQVSRLIPWFGNSERSD